MKYISFVCFVSLAKERGEGDIILHEIQKLEGKKEKFILSRKFTHIVRKIR